MPGVKYFDRLSTSPLGLFSKAFGSKRTSSGISFNFESLDLDRLDALFLDPSASVSSEVTSEAFADEDADLALRPGFFLRPGASSSCLPFRCLKRLGVGSSSSSVSSVMSLELE